jgi:putative transcriptional regulator
MSKMFEELKDSLDHAIEYSKGRKKPTRVIEYGEMEVANIRLKLKMSQQELADLIGISKGTIENWEQGRRNPTGAARALLKILNTKPKVAVAALRV